MKQKWPKIEVDPLHSICTYLGSFPPELANFFINYFTDENDVVYDPFSGRGTSLLEARRLNRHAISSDLNPISIYLSKSKSCQLNRSKILARIKQLKNDYDYAMFYPEVAYQDESIQVIFHPSTLAELCYLKFKLLNSKLNEDVFLISCLLGIIHGGERKDGTSKYLSISMPNTFSMSPGYVKRYVERNQLNRCYRNTFENLYNSAKNILDNHVSPKNNGEVFYCDAKQISKHKQLKKYSKKVDLIITSPPYLDVVNYAKQNWIRTWLVNLEPDQIELDDNLNMNAWMDFSLKTTLEMKKLMKDDGVMIQVIGDVARPNKSIIPLARDYSKTVIKKGIFKNAWIYSDVIEDNVKSTRIWKDKSGNATKIDRIVIMSDINPFEDKPHFEFFNYEDIIRNTESLIF